MKFILIIFYSIVLVSCDINKTMDHEKHQVLAASVTPISSSLKQLKLDGIWYTYNPDFSTKELLFYKKRKNEEKGLEYEVNFKKNGEISFKILTRELICGNGILQIEKGVWKVHHEKFLFLKVSGGHILESNFETELEYEILDSKEGILHLKLSQTLKHCSESFNRDMYLDYIKE